MSLVFEPSSVPGNRIARCTVGDAWTMDIREFYGIPAGTPLSAPHTADKTLLPDPETAPGHVGFLKNPSRIATPGATPAGTYVIQSGVVSGTSINWGTTYKTTLTVEPDGPVQVTAEAPTYVPELNKLITPTAAGVEYVVNGAPAPERPTPENGEPFTVTARSTDPARYELTGETSWTFTPPRRATTARVGEYVRFVVDDWLTPEQVAQSLKWSFKSTSSIPPGMTLVEFYNDVVWGTPTTAGGYAMTIEGKNRQGNVSSTAAGAFTVTSSTPDPDPTDPDPTDPEPTDPEPRPDYEHWIERVSTTAVRLIGRRPFKADGTPSQDLITARVQAPLVAAFVEGYTRGRGFTDGLPTRPLEVVVQSALSRLVQNPEQVDYYSVGDYSEKGAKFAGFTLPELYILNRYRKLWA